MDLTGAGLHQFGHVSRDAPAVPPSSAIPRASPDVAIAGLDVLKASAFNSSEVLAARQAYQLEVISSAFSSCSALATLCAIYWFCMMRRNFRRDLILLLICGDFWKASWLVIGSSVFLGSGAVKTESAFCQASGYFLQVGVEACDCAILLMSLHMCLQIFPPKNSCIGHDGLYRIRHWIMAGWFVVPNVLVSLAFTNTHYAFIFQGGFCTPPIRPFWYRLALSYIPRYLVWIYVMYVAIRIYRHVGYEFKVFGQEQDRTSTLGLPDPVTANTTQTDATTPMQRRGSTHSDAAAAEKAELGVAPDEESIPTAMSNASLQGSSPPGQWDPTRRQSAPNWSMPFGNTTHLSENALGPGPSSPRSRSNPSSRRGSKHVGVGIGAEDFAAPPPLKLNTLRGSVSTAGSMKSSENHSPYGPPSPGLDTITEHCTSASTTATPSNAAMSAVQQRRHAIQRQLRLLFIYPVVYLIIWIFPFVSHAMNYSNHYAQHPIFAINVLAIFCHSIMGLVDVIVFCWRERPWRHIPGSDGTFLGSFLFWRFAFGAGWQEQRRKSSAPLSAFTGLRAAEKQPRTSSQTGLLGSLKRWSLSISGRTLSPPQSTTAIAVAAESPGPKPPPRARATPVHRHTRSGGSDRRVLEAERAHERLQLERAEYERQRRSWQERATSMSSGQLDSLSPGKRGGKDWWDRQMSLMDDEYDESDV